MIAIRPALSIWMVYGLTIVFVVESVIARFALQPRSILPITVLLEAFSPST